MKIKRILLTCVCVCVVLLLCCSCYSSEEYLYYSQKENYIEVEGTVSYIKYNEDSTALYIGFSKLSTALDDSCFKIVGDNLKIVKDNNIDDKLTEGEKISFVTAPKYFGDGYVMPIVSLTINGEILLEFDEGYTNFLNWLSE